MRNGLQEWEKTAGSVHWFGKAQSCFRNCVPEEKHKLLWERKIGLRVSHPLCLVPWDVMGELHLNTEDPNVVLFYLFHITKVQREDPSIISQIQVMWTYPDPFPKEPLHVRASLA